jgi:type IV pilus assembly protein PilM
MSHTITGIDLGSWSVKFTVLEVGFRRNRVAASFEEKLTHDERPLVDRQNEALQKGVERLPTGTIAYVALPGDAVTMRALDLPFADARKIDQVVGYEMEGQMIHELHDVILDHVVLASRGPAADGSGGCRALVVAARLDEVRAFLASMQACQVDARALYVAPLLYRPTKSLAVVEESGPSCRIVMDIGHRRTNLCFLLEDEVVFARTILHGGSDITKSLVAASNGSWTWEQAEQGKQQIGFVASSRKPAVTSIEIRVDTILREALASLLRDVRQTLGSFAVKDKTPISEILLTGGGARLKGLAGYLEDELGVPVQPLLAQPTPGSEPEGMTIAMDERGEPMVSGVQDMSDAPVASLDDPEPTQSEADRFVLANTIAEIGARGQKQIDLRRGEFQYKASFSIVRQRARHLAVLAIALVASIGIHSTITLRRLSAEQRVLKQQFDTAAKELFGETKMEASDVSAALRRSMKDEMAPLPKATAYDLLDAISAHMPAADKVTVDIEDLDIRPKKAAIKGTVDSAAAVDEIVAKLKEIDCFEEISKGPITEVSGGAKQFSLAITSKCP